MKENLKNYLESLFINAPKTPANDALFEELLGNLYDKYDDLIGEGLSESEALARVIAELGDIRPLFEGVAENGSTDYGRYGNKAGSSDGNGALHLSPDELRRTKRNKGLSVASAVMLFILWLVPTILFGVAFPLFLFVAAGVTILVLSARMTPHYLDDSAKSYPEAQRERDTRISNRLQALGIGLLILSVLPAALIATEVGAALMFLFIALGVGMLIYAAITRPVLNKAPTAPREVPVQETAPQRKNRLLLPIITVSVVLVLTCTVLLATLGGLQFGFSTHGTDLALYTNQGSATVEGTVDRLFIEWEAGQVTVEPYDGDCVTVYETNNGNAVAEAEDALRWYLSEGALHIRFDGRPAFRWRFGKALEKQLIVRIPRDSALLQSMDLDMISADLLVREIGVKAALNVTTVSGTAQLLHTEASIFVGEAVSGEINVANASFTKLSLEAVSGTLSLADVSANEADFETVSGEIKLLRSALQRVEAETTSGEFCYAPTCTVQKISFDSTSGDFTLILPADYSGFQLEFETGSGDMSSDFAAFGGGEQYRYGDGSTLMQIETTSGDVYIVKEQK